MFTRKENVGLISDDHLIFMIKYTGDVQWEPLMSVTVSDNYLIFSIKYTGDEQLEPLVSVTVK